MDRRAFICATAATVLATASAVDAQPTGKVWRIGFLSGGTRTADGAPPAALRKALDDLGYLDGKSVLYVSRWAEAKSDRLSALATELVDLHVDLIVTFGAPAAFAAKHATSSIPIVISGAGDAAGIGLIASLAHPGGNVTGITDPSGELSAKRLELLKEIVALAARVAVLWNADDPAMTLRYREIDKAASALRVTVQQLGVRAPDDFDAAFSAMARDRPDALLLLTDSLTSLNRRRVLDFAAANRIPAMYEFSSLPRDGGLVSYGSNLDDWFRRTAATSIAFSKARNLGTFRSSNRQDTTWSST
jgi:putative ABC transport system substrate-binding protein